MKYTLTWRNETLAAGAGSIGEMAQALEDAAGELRRMGLDGVTLDPEGGGHAVLVTTDEEVARRYGFEGDSSVVPTGQESHVQVWVERAGGGGALVDEGVAPLIRALWGAGIDTLMSCQENRPGVAWLCFPSPLDAAAFLDRVAVHPDEREMRIVNDRVFVGDVPFWETLFGRITGCGGDGDWEYDVKVLGLAADEGLIDDEVVETRVGPSDIAFLVSVRFPTTDLPLILERLRAAAASPSRRG